MLKSIVSDVVFIVGGDFYYILFSNFSYILWGKLDSIVFGDILIGGVFSGGYVLDS